MSTAAATRVSSPSRGRWVNIGLWALQILAAAAFFAAGGFKLAGAPMMVQIFDQIGVGQWFRIVTGIVEVSGAALLLVPRRAALGGLMLAATMVVATLVHLFVIGGNPAPAIVLFAITATIAWARRAQLGAVLGR